MVPSAVLGSFILLEPVTKKIFYFVANSLLYIARKSKLTYNEVNVLLYYLIIPISWTILFDCWLGLPLTTAALLLVWLGIIIVTRHYFRQWCDWAFKDSVDFFNWFNRFGGNYKLNSVIICVIMPIFIYLVLIWLLI